MKLIIRQPTSRELRWISSQLTSDLTRTKTSKTTLIPSFSPELLSTSKKDWKRDGQYFATSNPRVLVHQSTYQKMIGAIVPTILSDADIRVAALASVPDEATGWIAWNGGTLLFVRVLGEARRIGIATALFESTGLVPDCPCAWVTADGVGWMKSMSEQEAEVEYE